MKPLVDGDYDPDVIGLAGTDRRNILGVPTCDVGDFLIGQPRDHASRNAGRKDVLKMAIHPDQNPCATVAVVEPHTIRAVPYDMPDRQKMDLRTDRARSTPPCVDRAPSENRRPP